MARRHAHLSPRIPGRLGAKPVRLKVPKGTGKCNSNKSEHLLAWKAAKKEEGGPLGPPSPSGFGRAYSVCAAKEKTPSGSPPANFAWGSFVAFSIGVMNTEFSVSAVTACSVAEAF
jgi:hypothetical protein